VGLAAQTTSPTASPAATPTPSSQVKDKWQLGFTALKDKQLGQENKYLCYSLPLLLKESLKTITNHKLSEEEKNIYRQQVRNGKLSGLQKSLDSLKESRDKKFFNKFIENPAELETSTSEEGRELLLKQINEVAAQDPGTISIPDSVGLEIKVRDTKDQLFPLPFLSLLEAAKINNIDLLVWGELEEIQDYLYLHIGLYNVLQEKNVTDFEYASAPDKIYDLMPKIIDKLATYILGRPWAALTIKPEPAVSMVEMNGKLKGLGLLTEPFIEPGE
jgi:hypothetical protein